MVYFMKGYFNFLVQTNKWEYEYIIIIKEIIDPKSLKLKRLNLIFHMFWLTLLNT